MAYTEEQIQKMLPEILQLINQEFPYRTERRGQKILILRIVKSFLQGKKFFILEAPTGAGKSVIAYTASSVISRLINKNCENPENMAKSLILTKTKSLQTQYTTTFSTIPTLWSAAGYECARAPEDPNSYYGSYLCDKALCVKHDICEYRIAKEKFFKSQMGILNYAFFLAMQDYKSHIITLDECHTIEAILCDHLSIKFNYKAVNKCLEDLIDVDMCDEKKKNLIMKQLRKIVDIEQVTGWLDELKLLCRAMYPAMKTIEDKIKATKEAIDKNEIEDMSEERKKKLYHNAVIFNALSGKTNKLVFSDVEWIITDPVEGEVDTIEFKPVSLAQEAAAMFKRGQFFILMSATICGIPTFAKDLGIEPKDYASESLDSVVPIESRKIFSIGLPSFSKASRDKIFPDYINTMDGIISQINSDQPHRGLIHSVTFENAEHIVANSRHHKKMFIPTPEEVLSIKEVMAERPDRIAVSPSLTEGSDLADDLCRFQVLLKVPFPYLGDAWIKRKRELSNDWYVRETINVLVQSLGRGVRSETDWCYNFVLDSNFNRILNRTDLFPHWFHKAIVTK